MYVQTTFSVHCVNKTSTIFFRFDGSTNQYKRIYTLIMFFHSDLLIDRNKSIILFSKASFVMIIKLADRTE